MKALFIQHDHISPPGPVADRLEHHGFEIEMQLVVPEAQHRTPNVHFEFPDVNKYDLLIPMGAPWGAWDDGCIGNWLQPELDWVRNAVLSDKPVLGICFGGQLMARALGGSVARALNCEIGWKDIWTDRPDIVSSGPWYQFHYDRWVTPPGAVEVARNPFAPQAFIYNRSLALQFHPELIVSALQGWLDWDGRQLVIDDGQDPDVMMAQTLAYEEAATKRTYDLVDAFLKDIAKLI
jgi:GMP synthase-like glutamine amidotransferase